MIISKIEFGLTPQECKIYDGQGRLINNLKSIKFEMDGDSIVEFNITFINQEEE